MRNKTTIRLTENDLNDIIAEAATRMINELRNNLVHDNNEEERDENEDEDEPVELYDEL